MARASGAAADGLITGEFKHKNSGVSYRVYTRDSKAWMSFEREGDPTTRGERELLYFIGSGRKGRSYLFSEEGYLFETPINWYSQEHRWNMTPAYTEAREIPMNLPAFTSCLNCHTSGLQPRVPGTRNRYTSVPFLHNGITCERCHGRADEHIAGKGEAVNPAKLNPQQRDSICMECHFEGTTAVLQPGKKLEQFRPGEYLSDYIHYFVLAGQQQSGALSQFEALWISKCKIKSGDKMWCGSCHDPHSDPGPEEKVAYYRNKCLSCHGQEFAAKHHRDKPDCVQCHMPSLPSQDVAHTQSTDHRILRNPGGPHLDQTPQQADLVPFPASTAPLITKRDLALAWEALAERGMPQANRQAERYLNEAVKEWPQDPSVLSRLAFVEQRGNHEKEARDLYQRALSARPTSNTAATNLGILEAKAANLKAAVRLWQPAFDRVPYRSEIGMDLAMTFCAADQKEEARRYVRRVLEFNPDYKKAKDLLRKMDSDSKDCVVR